MPLSTLLVGNAVSTTIVKSYKLDVMKNILRHILFVVKISIGNKDRIY